jgi:riboflavin transporter FmnP
MDSKKISVVAVFTALTIVLNMSPIKIPAPYAPFLFYQIWEIPIVTASLLYGFGTGVLISIINTLVLLVAFPGALPTGPIYNLIATMSTLFGIYATYKIIANRFNIQQDTLTTATSTAAGIITRVIAMTIINWIFLPFPPPIGFSMPQEAITPLIPLIGFFNATLALYTIPVGFILARAVKSSINFSSDLSK